jgi:hypothetical protein
MAVKGSPFLLAVTALKSFAIVNGLPNTTKIRFTIQVNITTPQKTQQMSIELFEKGSIERPTKFDFF